MRIDKHTQIYGLIGYPVKHSLSPAIQNAAFKHHKINAEYRLFEVPPEKLEDFLLKDTEVKDANGNSIRTKDIIGFNITIPHKVNASEILQRVCPVEDANSKIIEEDLYYVKLSGAINTVKRMGNAFEYRNTDPVGFLRSLEMDLKFQAKGKSAIVVGCGGAGRAVIAALSWKNKETAARNIYVYEISSDTVESAKKHFAQIPWSDYLMKKLKFIQKEELPSLMKECHLLINASPVGMKEADPSIIDKDLLKKNKHLFVYDVVYNRKTQLVKDAQELGIPAAGGEGMLLYQGAAAFEFWTDRKAPTEEMRQALRKEIDKCGK